MLEILARQLLSGDKLSEPVVIERFREWQQNDITQLFFHDIAQTFLDHLDDDLSTHSIDERVIKSAIREGEKNLLEHILDWKPANMGEDDD